MHGTPAARCAGTRRRQSVRSRKPAGEAAAAALAIAKDATGRRVVIIIAPLAVVVRIIRVIQKVVVVVVIVGHVLLLAPSARAPRRVTPTRAAAVAVAVRRWRPAPIARAPPIVAAAHLVLELCGPLACVPCCRFVPPQGILATAGWRRATRVTPLIEADTAAVAERTIALCRRPPSKPCRGPAEARRWK